MSKFFYDGKASKTNEHSTGSIGGNKTVRLGTKKAPAQISVKTEQRKQELLAIFAENKWSSNITVDADKAENILDLEFLQSKLSQSKASQAVSSKKANRNDPCPCGSGKKYKKCCGA